MAREDAEAPTLLRLAVDFFAAGARAALLLGAAFLAGLALADVRAEPAVVFLALVDPDSFFDGLPPARGEERAAVDDVLAGLLRARASADPAAAFGAVVDFFAATGFEALEATFGEVRALVDFLAISHSPRKVIRMSSIVHGRTMS